MQFEYTKRRGLRSPITDAPTFRVGRLRRTPTAETPTVDVSDIIDRSYNYHSTRELRWHLADRLGLAPAALSVREARPA